VKAAALRLALCAALFAGWVGYLAYLAAFTRDAVVLSRPQFLASDVDVVVTALEEPNQVRVEEVLFPADGGDSLKNTVITVSNLNKCRAPDGRSPKDWPAAAAGGRYLLPLKDRAKVAYLVLGAAAAQARRLQPLKAPSARPGDFEVVAVPPSPGFSGDDDFRVYPDGDETRQQYKAVRKPQ
jgi:hypothetical protein